MLQPELKTARDVSEYLLKVTADALMQQDFESFAAVFGLPQTLTTENREIRLVTRDDLEATFQKMCQHFQSLGVTELRRTCEAAAFDGPDRVTATHTSYVIANGEPVLPPYPVFSVLGRIDGFWKIMQSEYALRDDDPQAKAMSPLKANDDKAMAIYQDHLDRTTDSMMRSDFAAFRKSFKLPHTMRTETDVQIVSTVDEMRKTFFKFAAKYAGLGATDFVRIAKEAHFHAEDEIRGIHESHLIRNGTRLIPPYPNRVRLVRCEDGLWRETHSANAMLNTSDRFHLWAEVSSTPRLPDLDIDPERTSK